jgi:hypothetical protein
MKTLIDVRGVAQKGKSTTIKCVYRKLLEKNAEIFNVKDWDEGRKEIRALLKIGDIIVGIETRGDDRSFVEKALDIFKKNECNIIICATRTKGGTLEAVNDFIEKNNMYEYKLLPKSGIAGTTEQKKEDNKKFAKTILNLIPSR